MRKLNNIFFLSLALGSTQLNAQQTYYYTNDTYKFDQAVSLYNQNLYALAQVLFNEVKVVNTNDEIQANCAYYIANCAMNLNQEGAEIKMQDFIYNYPTSAKQIDALFELSNYYFKNAEYNKVLTYSKRVNVNLLSDEMKNRFYFQNGYCYFLEKNYAEAKSNFVKVSNSSTYNDQAKYYIGYISYLNNDYETASEYFGEVSYNEKYNEKMGYFKTDMNFKSGNFDEAIRLGKLQMSKATPEEQSELAKIIGESYFNLQKYQEALPYLEQYKGKNGRLNNVDFYQVGYAHYKNKDFDKAISEFNKIISGSDAVAQNAYYHLGESYLKTNQKTQALNAFKNASEMSFNSKIQEDAYVNYAKLSYEIGNPYQSTPIVITTFLEKYPNSNYTEELNSLLIDSYITSKNYKEALTLLEKSRTPQNKLAYQKVNFYRGLEMFNEGKYSEALILFDKSIAEQEDKKMVARATYWKGETQYALNQFNESKNTFNAFKRLPYAEITPEFKNLNYSLGYANFKLKNYDEAVLLFEAYTKSSKDSSKKHDAYLRLADSQFVNGKYWPAMESYNKVIEQNGADLDYAMYQKAISYGFVDRNDNKIKELNKIITNHPNSSYVVDAMYELGSVYSNTNKSSDAITTFNTLVVKYPNSTYAPKAILKQGLVHYNNEENNKALERFKKVVADYPKTPEAIEAVENARLVYVDSGNTSEYATWIKSLDFIDVSNYDLEADSYQAAEKQLFQNNTKQAIASFEGYLNEYPNGKNALKSEFNLAELYVSENQKEKAIPHYKNVVNKPKNEYTEVSLVRLSEYYLDNKSNEAKEYLKRLEIEAEKEQNKLFAQANLMKVHYEADEKQEALNYAEKVLSNSKIDKRVKADAQLISARAAVEAKDFGKAKQSYAELLKNASGEIAAEALYYEAYFKNADKKYEASNVTIQKLAKDYSSYKYYGAKGLVLMAKNFYGLNDSYQSTYILENVINNFSEYKDVVSEAKAELETIKKEESKRNSSIK